MEMIDYHLKDSLALLKFINLENKNIVDVGSGAGFPGVPLFIVSGCKMRLLEIRVKRLDFLKAIQEKLDLIHEQQQTALNLTPNEQKSKNLSSLYADVVSARSIKDAAPVNVNEAEKRYYKAKYGDSYEQRMASRYVKDARMLRQQMLQKHETQQHEMKQTLSYYESVRIYLKNIAEVQSTTLTKIKLLLDKIRMAEVNTNYRKSFYMEQEQKKE